MIKIPNNQSFAKQIFEIIKEYKQGEDRKLTYEEVVNLSEHLENRFFEYEGIMDLGVFEEEEKLRKEMYEDSID